MREAKLKLRIPMDYPLAQRLMAQSRGGRAYPIQISLPMVLQSIGYDLSYRAHGGLWLEAELMGLFPIDDAPLPVGPQEPAPIPMLLVCPACKKRHLDEGEFATKAHHTHACQHCGTVWRPAVVSTVGVMFLPGFKNEDNNVKK